MNLLSGNKRTPIGVDIGSKTIKAIQLAGRPGAWRVAAAVSCPRWSQDATVTVAEVRRLGEILHRRGFAGDAVVMTVPPEKLSTGLLELPPRSAAIAIDSLVRNEFCRAQKLDPQAVEIAHWDLPLPARAARGTHVMAAACPHDVAVQWAETFATVGLDLIGLDVRSLAVARGCAAAIDPAGGITAIVDLRWSEATLVVMLGNAVVFDRIFEDHGLSKLHSAFAAEMQMPQELADALLQNTDDGVSIDGLQAEASSAISAHMEALAAEVHSSVEYVAKRYPDARLGRGLLIGGGAALPNVNVFFSATLGVECTAVTPLIDATCAAALAPECSPAMTLAAGLARFREN